MAKKIYPRTPDAQTIAQDFDFEAVNFCKVPEITIDNLPEQEGRCIGFINGVPHYHNGSEMMLFNSGSRPSLDVVADLTIDWQTDLVPLTLSTYAQVFGNVIFKGVVVGDDGSGNFVSYDANVTYTKTGALINTLQVQNILYAGKLTFI